MSEKYIKRTKKRKGNIKKKLIKSMNGSLESFTNIMISQAIHFWKSTEKKNKNNNMDKENNNEK